MNGKKGCQKFLDYIRATFEVRNVSIATRPLYHIEGAENANHQFTIDPWDVHQISLNTGVSKPYEIEEFVKRVDGLFSAENAENGCKIIETDLGELPEELQWKNHGFNRAESITVLDAFKWYLYHKISELSLGGTRLVGIRDAIFAIKNELFLPDDFVPGVMMEMVEGSKAVDVHKSLEELQPSGQKQAILLFAIHSGERFLEPSYFYLNPYLTGVVPAEMDGLGVKIADSFSDFQKTHDYDNFLFSRIMRNVIFTVETKRKNELGKPLFDRFKLEILEKHGVVVIDGERGVIPDDLSLDELKKVKSAAEKRAATISDKWMNQLIRL